MGENERDRRKLMAEVDPKLLEQAKRIAAHKTGETTESRAVEWYTKKMLLKQEKEDAIRAAELLIQECRADLTIIEAALAKGPTEEDLWNMRPIEKVLNAVKQNVKGLIEGDTMIDGDFKDL